MLTSKYSQDLTKHWFTNKVAEQNFLALFGVNCIHCGEVHDTVSITPVPSSIVPCPKDD